MLRAVSRVRRGFGIQSEREQARLTGKSENRVEDVDPVSRPIGDTPSFQVLQASARASGRRDDDDDDVVVFGPIVEVVSLGSEMRSARVAGEIRPIRPVWTHLRAEDKVDELVAVDPFQTTDDAHPGEVPPGVTHLRNISTTRRPVAPPLWRPARCPVHRRAKSNDQEQKQERDRLITHILELLWSAIQPPIWQLSLR